MTNAEALEEERALRRIHNWFLEPIGKEKWERRKEAIEDHLESIHTPFSTLPIDARLASMSVETDRMGWYLYLLEAALNHPEKAEPTQGARIIPTFQRLGNDFDLLETIGGIEQKRARLLTVEADNPDSGLFEILVGLLWKRNAWSNVAFVPEAPPHRRPDLQAEFGDAKWAIECKRLAKSSEYSLAEREKWLRMWRPLSDLLRSRGHSVLLDIVFHVELSTLADDFLTDKLADKLASLISPRTVFSDNIWDVTVAPVDLAAARKHLQRNYVKYPSQQLCELVAGRRDPNRGFTSVVGGNIVRIGSGRGNNRFLDTMDFAAGSFWHCDAERSIERKARDIRTRLSEAISQLPDNTPSVVHIGLETLDGVLVEAKRYERILDTVRNFDPKGKDVRWVYCHLYQSYAPPDRGWFFDETVYFFSKTTSDTIQPLKHSGTIVPNIDATGPKMHWLKPPP
jgi:hypothetical protein